MRYEPVADNIWSGVIKQNYPSSTYVVGGKLVQRPGEQGLRVQRANKGGKKTVFGCLKLRLMLSFSWVASFSSLGFAVVVATRLARPLF